MLTRVILSVAIGLSFVFLRATTLGPIYPDDQIPKIIITFVVIYLFNLAFILGLGRAKRHLAEFAFAQLGVDCVGAGWLIYLTGGLESPLTFLFALYVTMGAIALYRRGAWFVVILSSGALCLLCAHEISQIDFERGRALRQLRYVLTSALYQIGVLSFIAMLTSYLSEQVRAAQLKLSFASADMKMLQRLNQHLLMSVYSGIIYCDRWGKIQIINQAAERLLGREATSLVNTSVQALFPRLPQEFNFDTLADQLEETSILTREGVYSWSERYTPPAPVELRESSLKGGVVLEVTEMTLNITLSQVSGEDLGERPDEEDEEWVLILQDVTLRHRLEARNERRERLASLGEVAAQIAHEVRNPLAGMLSSLELLRGRWTASERDVEQSGVSASQGNLNLELRLLDIIEREALRINHLTDSFLNFSRPPRPQPSSFRLKQLIEEMALLEPRIQSSIEVDFKVYADQDQVRQVLLNLFRNAWEAGSELVEVSARAHEPTSRVSEVIIVVADRGEGFSESLRDLDTIFKPFFSQKELGIGLGLSLCRSLAESQGGALEAARREGGGAQFRLTLPQEPPLMPLSAAEREALLKSAGTLR